MNGPRPNFGPSQGTESVTSGINFNNAPLETGIEAASNEILTRIRGIDGLSFSNQELLIFNNIIHEFSRGITSKCQHVLESNPSVVFTGSNQQERDQQKIARLNKMITNITGYFVESVLAPILKSQNRADGRTTYRMLYVRIAKDYFFNQLDSITLTPEAVQNLNNIASIPAAHITQIKSLNDFLTLDPAAKRAKILQIVKQPNFNPTVIRGNAIRQFEGQIYGHEGINYVGPGNAVLPDHFKVLIAMSCMQPAERREIYMELIGKSRNGDLDVGRPHNQLMRNEGTALRLGISLGDFTPVSFRSFVIQNISNAREKQRALRIIDQYYADEDGKQIFAEDFNDQILLERLQKFSALHVSNGQISSTLYSGIGLLNSYVSIAVNVLELFNLSADVIRRNQLTPDELQQFLSQSPALRAIAGPFVEFMSTLTGAARPVALILVFQLLSQMATEKIANPSLSMDQIFEQAKSKFNQSPNKISFVKSTFSSSIMKASYLSSNGFEVLHRETVLIAMKESVESTETSLPSLASCLNRMSQKDRNDFIKYVMGSFDSTAQNANFWSEFISEYGMIYATLANRSLVLAIYDHSLPNSNQAGAANSTLELLNIVTTTSASSQTIPGFAYDSVTPESRQTSGRLLSRDGHTPHTVNERSFAYFERQRSSEIEQQKEFILTESQRETLEKYGITAAVNTDSKEGIFTYTPKLRTDINPNEFYVVEDLRSRSQVWGTVTNIVENPKTKTLTIQSQNFIDIPIYYQSIPVMPQTPFQVMEGRVVANKFSIASNSGMRPNTAATISYKDQTSLSKLIPGVEFDRQGNARAISMENIARSFNDIRSRSSDNNNLSNEQYQLLNHLVQAGKLKMQGSLIVPEAGCESHNLEFDKNPSLEAMKTIETIQPQSTSIEFIGQDGNLQGVYLRNMHDIHTHIPHLYYLLVRTSEGRLKVLDVLNKLKEFSDGGETLSPIELLMLQNLTQMNDQDDKSPMQKEFIFRFQHPANPSQTTTFTEIFSDSFVLPEYGLVYDSSNKSIEARPSPHYTTVFPDKIDGAPADGKISFSNPILILPRRDQGSIAVSTQNNAKSLQLDRIDYPYTIPSSETYSNITINSENPLALVGNTLVTNIAELKDKNINQVVEALWVAPGKAKYASALLRQLNATWDTTQNKWLIPNTPRITVQVISGNLVAAQNESRESSDRETLSSEQIAQFQAMYGITLNPNPPYINLNTTRRSAFPGNAVFDPVLLVNHQDSFEEIQNLLSGESHVWSEAIPNQSERDNVISLPQNFTNTSTPPFTYHLGTKFNKQNLLQVVSIINSDLTESGYGVMVEFLRRHYGLTLNQFGTQFVIPDQHALKVINSTEETYSVGQNADALRTPSQDALKQRMGITISRPTTRLDPVVSYNLDYPYLVSDADITNKAPNQLEFFAPQNAPYFIGRNGRRKMVYFLEGGPNTNEKIQQRFKGLATSQYQILSRREYYQQLSQLANPSNNEQLQQGISGVQGITFANGRIQYASNIQSQGVNFRPPNFQESPEAFFIPPGASSCTFANAKLTFRINHPNGKHHEVAITLSRRTPQNRVTSYSTIQEAASHTYGPLNKIALIASANPAEILLRYTNITFPDTITNPQELVNYINQKIYGLTILERTDLTQRITPLSTEAYDLRALSEVLIEREWVRLNPQTNLLELTDNHPQRLSMEIASSLTEPQTVQALANLNTLTQNSDSAFPRTITLNGISFNYVGNANFALQDDPGTVLTVSSSSPAKFTIEIDGAVLRQNQTKDQILPIIQNIKTYRHVTRLIKRDSNVTAVSDELDQFNLKTGDDSNMTFQVQELTGGKIKITTPPTPAATATPAPAPTQRTIEFANYAELQTYITSMRAVFSQGPGLQSNYRLTLQELVIDQRNKLLPNQITLGGIKLSLHVTPISAVKSLTYSAHIEGAEVFLFIKPDQSLAPVFKVNIGRDSYYPFKNIVDRAQTIRDLKASTLNTQITNLIQCHNLAEAYATDSTLSGVGVSRVSSQPGPHSKAFPILSLSGTQYSLERETRRFLLTELDPTTGQQNTVNVRFDNQNELKRVIHAQSVLNSIPVAQRTSILAAADSLGLKSVRGFINPNTRVQGRNFINPSKQGDALQFEIEGVEGGKLTISNTGYILVAKDFPAQPFTHAEHAKLKTALRTLTQTTAANASLATAMTELKKLREVEGVEGHLDQIKIRGTIYTIASPQADRFTVNFSSGRSTITRTFNSQQDLTDYVEDQRDFPEHSERTRVRRLLNQLGIRTPGRIVPRRITVAGPTIGQTQELTLEINSVSSNRVYTYKSDNFEFIVSQNPTIKEKGIPNAASYSYPFRGTGNNVRGFRNYMTKRSENRSFLTQAYEARQNLLGAPQVTEVEFVDNRPEFTLEGRTYQISINAQSKYVLTLVNPNQTLSSQTSVYDTPEALKAYVQHTLVQQVSPSEALNLPEVDSEKTQHLLTRLRSIGAINASQQTIPSNLTTFTPQRTFRLTQERKATQTLVYKSESERQPTLEIHVPVAEGGKISVFQSVGRGENTLKSKVHEGPIRRQRILDQEIALNAEHLNLLSEIQGFSIQKTDNLVTNPVTINHDSNNYTLETKAERRGYQYILSQGRSTYRFARRQDLKSFLSETATFNNEERKARHAYFTSIGARQSDAFKPDGSVKVTSRTRLSSLSLGGRLIPRRSLDFQRTSASTSELVYEYQQDPHHYKLTFIKAGTSYQLKIEAQVAGNFYEVQRSTVQNENLKNYLVAIRANLQGFERLKAVQLDCARLNGVSQLQPEATDKSTLLRLKYESRDSVINFTLEIDNGNIVLKEGTAVKATQPQGGNQIQEFFAGLNTNSQQE